MKEFGPSFCRRCTVTTVLQLDAIKELVDIPQLIGDIEAGFVLYSQGRVQVPPVGFLHFDDPPGDVHIKYGSVTDGESYVLKMASGFPNNVSLGVPVADGVILVFSRKTGALELVLLDKCWLTDMRTAAAGAVAAKHLAPSTVSHIGIVGTGVQAGMQLELLRHVVDCQSCIIWGRNSSHVRALIERLQARPDVRAWGIEFQEAPDMNFLTSQCELIVTTTPAKDALIRADQVQPGTHITAMGSDDHGKQELEAALLGKADVVVADSVAQCVDHGECFHAVQDHVVDEGAIRELGTVIENPSLGRTNDEQITVADLTGVAIQDIQIAAMVNRAFVEKQTP
jgi:ornithine cyclodeaminase/alanine dehydrogenase-like protein (mu-crystallin family)